MDTKRAFLFLRTIFDESGGILARPNDIGINEHDGLEYIRVKGNNWARQNGYELFVNFDYFLDSEKVGDMLPYFYRADLPQFAQQILLREFPRVVFTSKEIFREIFPNSTPFSL